MTPDDAHILAKLLEDALESRDLETADSRAEVDESLSEIVFNAIEHGMTTDGAHSHVRYLPDRRGMAFDCAVVDRGPGVRANPGKGPDLPRLVFDRESLQLAVQEGVDVARPGPRPPEGPHPDTTAEAKVCGSTPARLCSAGRTRPISRRPTTSPAP